MSNVEQIYSTLGTGASSALVLLVVIAVCFGSAMYETWRELPTQTQRAVCYAGGATLMILGGGALGLGIHVNHLTADGMPGAPLVVGGVITILVGFFTATS